MKIIDLHDEEAIKNALYLATFVAAQNAKVGKAKNSDDLLFSEVDKDKDPRARGYNEATGQRGFFNIKTNKFMMEKLGNDRAKLIFLLGEYLSYAVNETPTFKQGDKEAMKIDAWEIKISKESKKILGRDLYLKVALLPSNKGIADDYCFLIDFHD